MRISDWSSDVCSSDLLYGISLIYGFSGTTGFDGIADAFATANSTGLTFGLVFVLVGLAFKIAAVPFHMWTPDVYEGAPTPVTAYFASAPTVAAMELIVRVAVAAMGQVTLEWPQIGLRSEERRVGKECSSTGRSGWAPDP